MSIALFFDENVNGILAQALRQRHVDVLTVQWDGMASKPDPTVFARSVELNRVLVSNDQDMLTIAGDCMDRNVPFPGLLFLNTARLREHMDSLEYIARTGAPEDFANCIWFLPL